MTRICHGLAIGAQIRSTRTVRKALLLNVLGDTLAIPARVPVV